MEGKLIKILNDLVYEKQCKSQFYIDNLEITLHFTDFWYTKIAQEIHQSILPTVFDPEKVKEIKNLTLRIMGAKIMFLRNSVQNNDTNMFFELVYQKL